MKFTFNVHGKDITIESMIRLKDSDSVITEIDTASLLGTRYIIKCLKSSENQVVTVSEKNEMFSTPLITNGGKSLLLVIDRAQGIINPYVTINNWSLRTTEKDSAGNVIVTSVIYPGDISELPDTIPLDQVIRQQASNKITDHVKTENNGWIGLIAALVAYAVDNRKTIFERSQSTARSITSKGHKMISYLQDVSVG